VTAAVSSVRLPLTERKDLLPATIEFGDRCG
jgi:hypothetical protein